MDLYPVITNAHNYTTGASGVGWANMGLFHFLYGPTCVVCCAMKLNIAVILLLKQNCNHKTFVFENMVKHVGNVPKVFLMFKTRFTRKQMLICHNVVGASVSGPFVECHFLLFSLIPVLIWAKENNTF